MSFVLPGQPTRPRLRRSAWTLLGVWLLVALLPLRAWAWAEMALVMGGSPAVVATAAAGLPPCHGPVDSAAGGANDSANGSANDSAAQSHVASCAQCLCCAAMLAGDGSVAPAAVQPGRSPQATADGFAPEGLPHSLFRPPRG